MVEISDQQKRRIVGIVRAAAREEILPRFRALSSGDVATKSSDSDLVTIADKAAEKRITEEVARLLPEALVVGEEAVAEDDGLLGRLGDADLSVIIDPIDGTWNYANNLPLFGVMLAVVAGGETVFGLLYDPMSDAWITARAGDGAFRETARGEITRLEIGGGEATDTGLVPTYLFPLEVRRRLVLRLAEFERVGSYRCSCHEYWLMAEGRVDFAISGHLKPWDHAAGELIYREAGGHAAMLSDGAPYRVTLTSGQLLLARTEAAWERMRGVFSGALSPA